MAGVAAVLLGSGGAVAQGNTPPAAPVITEPSVNGQVLNPEDVHMETGPFADPDPGDVHLCTDWEIWTGAGPAGGGSRAWAALCAPGLSAVHIHLADGAFEGSHVGRTSLLPGSTYVLRARHRDSSGVAASEWSPWTERPFVTGTLSSVFALELQDVAGSPTPALRDTTGAAVSLPGGTSPPSIVLVGGGGGAGALLLEVRGGAGSTNIVINPPALSQHVHVRARVVGGGGGAGVTLPETDFSFTSDHGVDHTVYLPALSVGPGQEAVFWVSSNGATYAGQASQTTPDFSVLARGAPVPWTAAPGFKVEVVATGFRLPVNIAFVPSPGPNPGDPYFYVTELYGTIRVVRRDGTVGTYADGLLNFNPTGLFPGSGEQGVTGIAVHPQTGDVYAALLYDSAPPNGAHYPRVLRFQSGDGGQTGTTQTIIRSFPGETQGQSHQISNLSFGPDGKLYVHMGDGFQTATAQNLDSYRGKVLRMNPDGSAPTDNPFYDAANGINSRDYVFAYGVRNPFGGAWRDADGAHYCVENGPSVDRFARIVSGRNYLWSGTDASMANFALYNWNPSRGPVNLAFIQAGAFGGSGFPAPLMGRAYVSESGPTWGTGPQALGKRLREFTLDAAGALVGPPRDIAVYNGSGKASCVALAAGPDGLYFSDFYKDVGYTSPIDAGSNILRVRWVGAADFSAAPTVGAPPLAVQFTDASTVPSAVSWDWSFGDGATSTQQSPSHTFTTEGVFDVRLSVTGSGGVAVVQKSALVKVGAIKRVALIGGGGAGTPLPGDAAVAEHLEHRGFVVQVYDDEPANRPSAAALGAASDLVLVSSTITASNVGGEFRTVNVPVLFWESALLTSGREPLTDQGTTVGGVTSITITNPGHPITQPFSTGVMAVFVPQTATMSVGRGTLAPGAVALATRAGASADRALMAAEQGAALHGYTAPARRVFFFWQDTSFLYATPTALDLFDSAVCWALKGAPVVTTHPQDLTVNAGAPALMMAAAGGAGPMSYQWRRDGVNLVDDGRVSGALTATLTISPAGAGDAGSYTCVIGTVCGTATAGPAVLTVNGACYANCDGSTQAPVLNVADFGCFLTRYAAGEAYANCDGSTQAPVLNVADFGCFLTRYAAGCP
ncbi:MAG: PQQ-dependent sugar dehydrogenase [Phycisphaerales bacterium]